MNSRLRTVVGLVVLLFAVFFTPFGVFAVVAAFERDPLPTEFAAMLIGLPVFERIGSRATLAVVTLLVLVNLHHAQPKSYLTFDDEYFYPDSIAQKGLNTTTREEYESRWVKERGPFVWGPVAGADSSATICAISPSLKR